MLNLETLSEADEMLNDELWCWYLNLICDTGGVVFVRFQMAEVFNVKLGIN